MIECVILIGLPASGKTIHREYLRSRRPESRTRRNGAPPDVAIFARAKRMVAPTRGEGFDELYRVSIQEDGEFEVNESNE